jgi:hypothetical protein
MKKYAVEIRYTATRCYVIEAETERGAERVALDMDIEKYPDDKPSRHRFDTLAFRDCETMAEVD